MKYLTMVVSHYINKELSVYIIFYNTLEKKHETKT